MGSKNLQISVNLTPRQGDERSTLEVRRSKVKVSQEAEVIFGSLAETSFSIP